MKRSLRRAIVSTSVLAITGGVLAATIGVAAASTPTWEPDPNAIGTLAFYNSAGVQITSGTDISHLFDYALASSADPSTHKGNNANLEFASPTPGENPALWPNTADESSIYPNSAAPGALGTATNPLLTMDAGGANLQAAASGFTPNTATGYVNVYQVRLYTTGANGAGTGGSNYWDADVQVSGNSWTEVYGSPVGTTTTLQSSANPVSQGTSVTFTSTTTDADGSTPAGTVQFSVNGSAVGGVMTPNGSGVATYSTSALTNAGSPYSVTATFTPTTGTNFSASTSSPLSESITPAATGTTTTLAVGGTYQQTGGPASLTGTVTPAAAGGTVSFYDNGSTTPINGSPVNVTGGSYTYSDTAGFAVGSHSVVAKFTPSVPATYAPSQSAPQPFTTVKAGGVCQSNPASQCTDTQNIKAAIPTGELVISTPYTQAAPLDLGTLALNSTGTLWTGSKPFQCIVVTDTDGINTGFNASAQASTLTQEAGAPAAPAGAATSISGENVGLTALAPSAAGEACPSGQAPVNSYTNEATSVTTTPNPAANGVPANDTGTTGLGNASHVFLTGAANGVGTVTYDGTLTLNAPTVTAPGTYDGTITFTVSDGE